MIFIDLPRMDGEQTLKNLKASAVSKCRDSKIYAILAETDKKGDQYYLNLGFDGIIRKPTEKCVMEYIIINHAPKKMLPEVGEKRVLHVDSISFDDYFDGKPFDASCKIFLFMGIGFAVIGLIATLIVVFAF